jgi:predicted regulator of Ras-like GTPase activity (Roadblock/LC7/MglB family)
MKITNKQLHEELQDLRQDIRDIKLRLLDPEDGLVVRINKNTSFRKNTRIGLWAVFAAIGGLVTEMILRK